MITVRTLTAEYATNPLGTGGPHPLLGWKNVSEKRGQRQSAYRILVSESKGNLEAGIGEAWDSGKCASGRNASIVYAGEELKSATRYYWKVCVWDEEALVSAWSGIAWWETGFLHPEDWLGGWIGSDGEAAPLFRREFVSDKLVERARLYIGAAGYYEAYLNGKKIGDHLLDPAFTLFDKRNLYVVYELEPLLLEGANCVGVELGRGFYGLRTPNVWNWHQAPWNGNPRFIAQLELQYADGSGLIVKTDESWELIDNGPLLSDSVYAGERYDARKYLKDWYHAGFRASDAKRPIAVAQPSPRLEVQALPPIRVVGSVEAVGMTLLGEGHYVFDLGEMMAGWVETNVQGGRAGTAVTFVYGEKLNEAGRVDILQDAVEGAIQTDRYIKRSEEAERWEPKFSYKGFRYVEIRGEDLRLCLANVVGKRLHTDLRGAGSFHCSNALFNRIHEATRRTLLNNFHGILTDTPVYEKNGWLGDAQLIAETAEFQFDMATFWEKWLNDMRDCQRADGFIPVIVPDSGWGTLHAPEWSCAYVLIAWRLYWYYDNGRVLQEHYDSLKRYAEYETDRLEDGMPRSDLGDWVAPGCLEGRSPEGGQITSAVYVHLILRTMRDIADIVGRTADRDRYAGLADKVAESLNRECLDRDEDCYRTDREAGYRQTSSVLPLALSLVPADAERQVAKRLIDDLALRTNGHADVGILGHKHFYPALTRLGYGEEAYRAANFKDYPSMGLWFEHGATSLWEYWDTTSRSRNHYMFGSIVQWFYEYIAGIRQTAAGWAEWEAKPHPLGDLTSAEATLDTVRGTVHVGWSRSADDKELVLSVHVPVQSRTVVHVPLLREGLITESGQPADQARGVRYTGDEGGYRIYEVGAGRYAFASR